MKKYLLVTLFLVGFSSAWAQRVLVEPYAIGLVEDYKGRKWKKENPQEEAYIDKFHYTEAKLLVYFDSLITESNKRTYDKIQLSLKDWEEKNCFYCHEFKLMYSAQLAEKVNDAYSFKWDKEEKEPTQKVFVGKLKPNPFKTPQEKASFLAGAFVRYGFKENGSYTFRFSGTASKFEAVLRELKALRCDILEVKIPDTSTGAQQISFVPSEQLRAYLDKQDRIRKDILTKKEAMKKEKGDVKEIFDSILEQ